MRTTTILPALLTTFAALAAGAVPAPAASAQNVVLWACHGPEGQPLGAAPLQATGSGDGVATTYGGGCSGQDAGLQDGGVVATFTRPDPAGGSAAGWRIAVPLGATLTSVSLDRDTSGFAGLPQGDPVSYALSASGAVLESASAQDAGAATRSGSASFAAKPSSDIDFGVACGAGAASRCSAPDGDVGVDVSSLDIAVSDGDAPLAGVAGIESPVTGPLPLTLQASDDGLGLESATVDVDGQPVVAVALGGASCAPLAASGTDVNLALGADCPAMVSGVPLTVSTASLADGPHHLTVTVTDAAGNSTTPVDKTVVVNNHPDIAPSSVILAIGTGGTSPTNSTASPPGGAPQNGVGATNAPVAPVSTCRFPRLTAKLASRPLRRSHHLAVLYGRIRYLFTGRLTCIRDGHRVGARAKTVVGIESRVGKRLVPRTGAAVYHDGRFRVLLHPRSTRIIDFHYGAGASKTVVRIHVVVTYKRPARKPRHVAKRRKRRHLM